MARHRRPQADRGKLSELASIAEFSDDAIIGGTPQGVITSWNRGAEKIYGYSAGEVQGRHVSLLTPLDRSEECSRILEKIQKGETTRHFETLRLRKDGGQIDVSLTASPVKNAAGEITGFVAIARDITGLKRTADNLVQMAAIVESADDAIVSTTADGLILSWNQAAEKLFGYSAEEVQGRPVSIFYPVDSSQELSQIITRLNQGERIAHFETVRVRKDGSLLNVSLTLSPTKNETGNVTGVSSIARDISDRKRAAEELAQQKEMLQTIFDQIPVIVMFFGPDGKIQLVNRGLERTLGWSQENWGKQEIFSQIFPDPVECQQFREYMRTKPPGWRDFKTQTRNGKVLDIAWATVPLSNGRSLGIGQDVTERKRVAEKLAQSENTARDILENSGDLIQSVNAEGRFEYVNHTWLEILGYTAQEMRQMTFLDILRPDQVEHCKKIFAALHRGEAFPHIETVFRSKDGRDIFVEGSTSSNYRDGRFISSRGFFRDVTERKRAGEALRENEERTRLIVERAYDAFIAINADGRITDWNPQAELTFGWSRAEALQQPLATLIIPERYRKAHKKGIKHFLATGEGPVLNKRIEMSALHRDGHEFPAELSISAIRRGETYIFTAFVHDITERKRAEAAVQKFSQELEQRVQDRTAQLQQSEGKFRGLLESAPDAIVGSTAKGQIILVNAQTEKLFGYTREELLGKPVEMLLPDRLQKKHVKHRKSYNSNPPTRIMGGGLELIGRRKDGSEVPVEVTLSPLQTNEGVGVTRIIRDVTNRKRTQKALQESEDRFRAQYKGFPVSTLTWQRVGEDFLLIDHNDVALDISRGRIRNFIGKTASDFYNDRLDLLDSMRRCFRKKGSVKRETPFRLRTTAEDKHIAFTYTFIPPDLVMTHAEDITERERMAEALRQREEQLRHAQKMEAIGQLAGGVAHDFNNLLTGIIGYSDLLMKKLGPDHPFLKQAGQIKKAGDQAAVLTGQLLAFSRKQVLQPQVVDLNHIVTEMDEMLRRLLGEDITLVTALSPALGKTKADPSQIEQVILNLVSNARDAMPEGGTLTIATKNIERKQTNGHPGPKTKARRHVMLTVSDTGRGMDGETLEHIFEPFFTTKEKGKGTGLGLASVYGVVQQSGGHIQVSSTPGQGTKFQIYLSQVDIAASTPKPDAVQPVPSGGRETILLVEDSDQVRELVCQCLQDEGYTVLAASISAEAVQITKEGKQKIDMLLTDVIMPGMSGPDLAQLLTKNRKDLKVLFLSGFSDHPLVQQGISKPNISFLAKPFTLEALLHKVREVFDASKSRPAQKTSPAKTKSTRLPKPAKAAKPPKLSKANRTTKPAKKKPDRPNSKSRTTLREHGPDSQHADAFPHNSLHSAACRLQPLADRRTARPSLH